MKKTVVLLLLLFLLFDLYAENCKVCEIYKRMLHNPDDSYQLPINLDIDGDIVGTLKEDHSEGLVTFIRLIKKLSTGYIVINSYIDAIIKNGESITFVCSHDYSIQYLLISSQGSDNGRRVNVGHDPGLYASYLEKFTN